MALGLRIAAGLFGLVFIWNGIQWLFMPAQIAERLGMPLLTAIGGSTQIGDFASFFIVGGVLAIAGTRPGQSHLFLAPMLLLASAALFRTWAWFYSGMDFATTFIAVESVSASLLFLCFHYLPKLDRAS